MTAQTENSSHHIIPVKIYLGVFAALLILTAVTIAVSIIDLGGFNVVVALVVAGIKASLVALFFMHLLYDNKLNLVIFLTAITFLVIFITFTMFDTMHRDDIYLIKSEKINENAPIYDDDHKGGPAH